MGSHRQPLATPLCWLVRNVSPLHTPCKVFLGSHPPCPHAQAVLYPRKMRPKATKVHQLGAISPNLGETENYGRRGRGACVSKRACSFSRRAGGVAPCACRAHNVAEKLVFMRWCAGKSAGVKPHLTPEKTTPQRRCRCLLNTLLLCLAKLHGGRRGTCTPTKVHVGSWAYSYPQGWWARQTAYARGVGVPVVFCFGCTDQVCKSQGGRLPTWVALFPPLWLPEGWKG